MQISKINVSIGISMILPVILIALYAYCIGNSIPFRLYLLTIVLLLVLLLVLALGVWFIIREFL